MERNGKVAEVSKEAKVTEEPKEPSVFEEGIGSADVDKERRVAEKRIGEVLPATFEAQAGVGGI